MKNIKNQLLNELRVYLDKHQRTGLAESSRKISDPTLKVPWHTFSDSHISCAAISRTAVISLNWSSSFYSLQNTTPIDIIHGASLALRRFYSKFGTNVHENELFVNIGRYNAVIYVALNTYGLRQVMQKARIQAKALHRHS